MSSLCRGTTLAACFAAWATLAGCSLDGMEIEAPESESDSCDGWEIVLDEVDDGRIFQRNQDGQFDLSLEGTFCGGEGPLEARVVASETLAEITPWRAMEVVADKNTFAGTLAAVPQGGWYKVQVRFAGNDQRRITGEGSFGVGVLIGCTGQSQIDYWFDPDYEGTPPAAHELTRMYRHEQKLQAGPEWSGWQVVTGMGARVFAANLADALGIPIGLLDYGVQGSALWQNNSIDGEMGWWLADDSELHPDAGNYEGFRCGLDSIENTVEALLWVQGHTDAMQGESKERYKEGLTTLLARFREDTQVPQLPVFLTVLPRQAYTADEAVEAIRDAVREYCAQDAHAYLGSTTMDLPLCADHIHHAPEGQKILAQRLAQAVLHVIVGEQPYSYHRGPHMESAEVIDGRTIDVHLLHTAGTDFCPQTEIAGFRVLGEGKLVIQSALRLDRTTIRLTVSGDTDLATGVEYLYGANPGNLDLETYATQYVHDNTPLALPLEGGSILF